MGLLLLAVLGVVLALGSSSGKKSSGGKWSDCIDPGLTRDEGTEETVETLEWLSAVKNSRPLTLDERAAIEAAANACESKGYLKLAACMRSFLKG